jgi:hypothetical protein
MAALRCESRPGHTRKTRLITVCSRWCDNLGSTFPLLQGRFAKRMFDCLFSRAGTHDKRSGKASPI